MGDTTMLTAAQIAAKQAKDYGLWFVARTASEAYLQQELRRLTAAVEAEAATLARSAQPAQPVQVSVPPPAQLEGASSVLGASGCAGSGCRACGTEPQGVSALRASIPGARRRIIYVCPCCAFSLERQEEK